MKWKIFISIAVITLVIILVASVGYLSWVKNRTEPASIQLPIANNPVKEKGMKVSIMVHSGLPDPFYVLDDKNEIEQLKSLIRKTKPLERPAGTTVIQSILGYKGISIYDQEGFFLAVYGENLETNDSGIKFMVDKHRAIEKFLLKIALKKNVINDAMYTAIMSRK